MDHAARQLSKVSSIRHVEHKSRHAGSRPAGDMHGCAGRRQQTFYVRTVYKYVAALIPATRPRPPALSPVCKLPFVKPNSCPRAPERRRRGPKTKKLAARTGGGVGKENACCRRFERQL